MTSATARQQCLVYSKGYRLVVPVWVVMLATSCAYVEGGHGTAVCSRRLIFSVAMIICASLGSCTVTLHLYQCMRTASNVLIPQFPSCSLYLPKHLWIAGLGARALSQIGQVLSRLHQRHVASSFACPNVHRAGRGTKRTGAASC